MLSKETTLNSDFDDVVQATIEAEMDPTVFVPTYQGSSCKVIGAH